jgi:hypothetical protein
MSCMSDGMVRLQANPLSDNKVIYSEDFMRSINFLHHI